MFKTRLISGIVLIAVLLVTIIPGGKILYCFDLIISLIGLFELYRVFEIEKKLPGIIGYLSVVVYYLLVYFNAHDQMIMLTILTMILLLMAMVLFYPKYTAAQIMAAFFGIFYVAVMLSYIYQTRMMENGQFIVWLIFLCSWGSDTCAYCVGKLFGKHKMSPVLSPKKSVEGGIGGVVGAMLLTFIYLFCVKGYMGITNTEMIIFSLIAGAGALISMVGDLAASAIKRNYDIKDYGNLIPGHGGILDRFDSVIITAPIIFYLASCFI